MNLDRASTLQRLASSSLTLGEAAAALGTTEARAAELLEVYSLTREVMAVEQAQTARRVRVGLLSAGLLLAASGVSWWSTPAWAQSCPQTLPSPMVTFCPDAPARATAVNGNFQQAVSWLTQKAGPVGDANITTSGNLNFGQTTRQMINLWQTGYGIGVQNSTTYFRSGGGYAWYLNGAHADATNDSGGGSTLLRLDSGGSLFVGNDLSAPSNSWGVSSDTAAGNFSAGNAFAATMCPAGRYVCGVLLGHVVNDGNYWTGARVILRCCGL